MMVSDFANFEIFRELRTTVYPSNMAPIGLKICQNAFQTIPNISFCDTENITFLRFCRELWKACSPPKDGSVWPQTLPKRVSDDPRHFIFQRRKIFSKLRTAVYPPNMAPIGAKLCQNAFQTIPNISFSDVEKICSSNFFVHKTRFRLVSSSFGVATIFWTPLVDSPRKLTPKVLIFKSLRPLAHR